MRTALPLLLTPLLIETVSAAVISQTWLRESPIPDNSLLGLADTRTITSGLDTILDLTVTLEITGGWNGDLYAYLQHGPGFTVLLNRIGRTAADWAGSGTSGMSVTLAANALLDVHAVPPSTGSLTGRFQPDGRFADPEIVLDSSPRGDLFQSFAGLSPDGDWTLFIADLNAGEISTLRSWTLEISAIPEPAGSVLLAFLAGLFPGRRQRRNPPAPGVVQTHDDV